jgi:hypothetical protein
MLKITFSENGMDLPFRYSQYILNALLIVISLSTVSIFLYKKPALQLRLVSFNILFIFLIPIAVYLQGQDIGKAFDVVLNWQIGWLFYLCICLLLLWNFLAIRGIVKDINLLKSADRLR